MIINLKIYKTKLILTFLFILSSFQFCIQAQADDIEELANKGWRIIESKYTTIISHPDVDINEINRKIRIRFYDIFLYQDRNLAKDESADKQLANKIDIIFQKVEKILDMYPRRIHLKVMIYKDQSLLDMAYAEVFGSLNERRFVSFYVHKYTTIYTTKRVISERVIAHEISHAVVDHYFLILPPEKIKELLSQYVEIHLED